MKRNKPMKWLYGFLVCLLVFASVPVSGVSADNLTATIDPTKTKLLQTNINANGETIELELDNGNWADFSKTETITALRNSMVADVEQDKWDAFKENVTASVDSNNSKILVIKLPAGENYSILENQKISINLNGALLENWNDDVNSVEFEIMTPPKLLLEGTIFNATSSDIKQGGKTIELKLLNAKWDTFALQQTSNLEDLLKNFKGVTSTWSPITELLSKDPATYVSFPDASTLKITLPALNTSISSEKIDFDSSAISSYYTVDNNDTFSHSTLSFDVFADTNLSLSKQSVEESLINTTGDTIILTLSSGEWSVIDSYKEDLLIDSLVPINQAEEWNRIKEYLKQTSEASSSASILTWKLQVPSSEKLYLKEDLQLKLKVPQQLLKEYTDIPEQIIMIEAQAKVISTNATIPSITQEDLIKGGKTIELSLVNSKWDASVASSTSNRESLLKWFNWSVLNSDGANVEAEIISKASVVRSSDTKVVITLPSLGGFKIKNNIPTITVTPQNTPNLSTGNLLESPIDIFVVENPDQVTAKVSGLSNVTEFDMKKADNKLNITLKNDTWSKALSTTLLNTGGNKLKVQVSGTTSPTEIQVADFTKISDTEISITLDEAQSVWNITNDTQFDLIIPFSLLTLSSQDLKVASAFKVLDVNAKLSGTAGSNIDAVTLEKGGKTIIITLNNAKFKENESVTVSDIMTSTPTDLTSEFVGSDITIKGNKLTIKLPKINTTKSGTLTFSIPERLIDHGGALTSNFSVTGTVNVGAKAEATLSPSSLTEATLKGTTFTIDLKAANWDSTIETNKSKQNTLLKGFTVDNQEDEWDNVIDAIKENGKFDIKAGDTTVLNIELPNNINYAIVRDQKVSLKIPKSVLADYKYDIEDVNSITIKSPSFTSTNKTFTAFLPELSKLSGDDIAKTRVYVPEKLLETIQVSNVAIPDSGNITTVVVETSKNAEVTATIITEVKNEDGTVTKTEVPQTKKDSSSTTFIFTNVDPKSELKVTVKDGNTVVEEYKKVGKGKKTYNLLPKKQLDGYYSLERILTDDKLLKDIFKYYKPNELQVGTISN